MKKMKQKFLILITILFITSSLISLWWKQAIKPVNSTDSTFISFMIKKEETARNIANRLQKKGLIRSSVAFFLLARFGGIADRIQAGQFRLKPSMDLITLAEELTHGTTDIWLTIPEGLRSEEIALKLAQELSIPEGEFLKLAKEGYMFPDTYLIPENASVSAIIDIFLKNFNKKVTPDLKKKADEKDLTLDEVIKIASLIEREAKLPEDRPVIASVILNRLKIGMKLDIDATIQYALGYQPSQKSWWKKNLTLEDLEIDSLFNTYKNPGLPPTPIANPGLAAIRAVVKAPNTEYLYYIADKKGKSHFAKTFEEHEVNIAKYLQ